MDPENPLKHRISRILSFISCKSCHVSDVVERPVIPRQHYLPKELFSSRPSRAIFSISGPKRLETEEMCMRQRGMDRHLLLCPPVSPVTALDTRREFEGEWPVVKDGEKKSSEKKNKGVTVDTKGTRREKKRDKTTPWPTNIANNKHYYDWSTSDGDDVDTDDDKTTLFSSKSISSDSSHSLRRSRYRHSRRSTRTADDRAAVRDGLAVVKRSTDPYGDFRNSMVEMIVEKQIFGARELQELLQTFLVLNTCHHHTVIVQVFKEICEALFSK